MRTFALFISQIYSCIFLGFYNCFRSQGMLEQILKEASVQQEDIVVKCKKYPAFRKELKEIQHSYLMDLKMAPYAKMKKNPDSIPFDICKRSKLFVNFYAYKMSTFKEEDFRDLYLHWIERMDGEFKSNPTKRYTIIYYHSMSTSINTYLFIKESFKKLPIQYYALLDKIYIVQSSFLLRNASLFEFSRLHKLYFRKLAFLENLHELNSIDEIKQNQILDGIPEVLALQQSLELNKKGDKTQKKMQMVPPKPPQDFKVDCLTRNFSEHLVTQNELPLYIEILVNTIRKHPQIMKLQGIFRKSGSIQEEEAIITELETMEKFQIIQGYEKGAYSGYAVAGVIKKFFTKLKKPVVPYAVYNWIMNLKNINQEQQNQIVREILMALPPPNKKVILYIINFIRSQVLEYKEQNKMNHYNMSVVFSPCFFRPETESFQDLINSGRYASILNILFNNYENIVGKSEPVSPIKKRDSENRESKGSKGSRESKGQAQSSLKPINTNL